MLSPRPNATLAEGAVSDGVLLQMILSNIHDFGIIMLDLDGCIVTWNAGARAITGYTAEEAAGKHVSIFYSASDIESRKPELELAAAISTGRYEDENWRIRKDGSSFWASVVVTPVRDPRTHECVGFAKVTRDMTERKCAEADIAAKTAALIRAEESEAFAHAVAHDLRAPIRHLDGFASLLRRNCYANLDAEGQRYLDKISDAAQRMGCLIDDLLKFSRLLHAPVTGKRVSLRTLLDDIRRDLEPDLAGRDITWIIGDLPEVYGDPSMLRQVFANLLSNAVKFTRDRKEARIEIGCAGTTDRQATIFVRDNGAGFDEQYADKLFGIFQRLHSNEFEGTGVGLANVRRIVERYGGRVWAEGAEDQGATFFCTLALPHGESEVA